MNYEEPLPEGTWLEICDHALKNGFSVTRKCWNNQCLTPDDMLAKDWVVFQK